MNWRAVWLFYTISALVVVLAPKAILQDRYAADTATIERDLLRLVNQERTQRGLQSLEYNEQLHRAAQQQAEIIAQKKQLSHRFPGQPAMGQRIAATGLHFDSAGENAAEVGDTGNAGRDAAEAHSTLMLSPPHRENILITKYNAAGIAAVSAGGHIWVVQDFARAYPDASVSEVEELSAKAMNRLRAQRNLPAMRIVEQPGLRQLACREAASASSALSEFSRARYALVYTVFSVDEWPEGRTEGVTDSNMHSAAIAACPAQTYGHGEFRVIVLFFPDRSDSAPQRKR